VIDPTHQSADADLFTPSASRLATLFFSDLGDVGRFEPVTVDQMPADYRTLLAHQDHMTVALESYHKTLVSVKVLDEWRDETSYARTSLLSRQSDGAVVQFGIMRIWLTDLPPEAQVQITQRKSPLGRVLIEHNVLREVEPISLWEITPGPVLKKHLQLKSTGPIFGRSAQILVDERPTVQLLEIPVLPDQTSD
jgi:chorismate-pyruvate lyase